MERMDSDHLSMRRTGKNHAKTAILQGPGEWYGTETVSEFRGQCPRKMRELSGVHA